MIMGEDRFYDNQSRDRIPLTGPSVGQQPGENYDQPAPARFPANLFYFPRSARRWIFVYADKRHWLRLLELSPTWERKI